MASKDKKIDEEVASRIVIKDEEYRDIKHIEKWKIGKKNFP